MLRLRNPAGRQLIAVGGTGLALQAVTVTFEGMDLALRSVLPLIAVMAGAAVFTAGRRAQGERFGLATAVFVLVSLSCARALWNVDLEGETASVAARIWFLRLLVLSLPLFTAALTPQSGRAARSVGYVFASLNVVAIVLGASLDARVMHVDSMPDYLTALFLSVAAYCYRDLRTRRNRATAT
ncbi:hypothetical protein ABZ686_08795 [Streptomyces sp. NPDC006992]|uniref:hypothetical protein n=1 Tax=Streptomyces sp. NPDC006992 TaxID=3155601 RepID=UPI0033E8906A